MKKTAVLFFTLTLIILTAGCAKKAKTQPETAAPAYASLINASVAKQTALQSAGISEENAVFTKVWQDYDDGIQEWEIDFVSNGNKYEVELNAADGSIRKTSCTPVEKGVALNGCISSDEAKQTALAAAGVQPEDVVFTKVESDFDDGIQKWEIEFLSSNTMHEIELNAADGKIIGMSMEMLKIME